LRARDGPAVWWANVKRRGRQCLSAAPERSLFLGANWSSFFEFGCGTPSTIGGKPTMVGIEAFVHLAQIKLPQSGAEVLVIKNAFEDFIVGVDPR
jgi:hypothetical protein